jgi:hypothetical protein
MGGKEFGNKCTKKISSFITLYTLYNLWMYIVVGKHQNYDFIQKTKEA